MPNKMESLRFFRVHILVRVFLFVVLFTFRHSFYRNAACDISEMKIYKIRSLEEVSVREATRPIQNNDETWKIQCDVL